MKAILKFDLEDPDDMMAHKRCVKARDMACALHEIYNNLERRIEQEPTKDYTQIISDIFEENNIIIDELIY